MQSFWLTVFTLLLVGALSVWYRQIYHRRPKSNERLHDDTPSYLKRESLLLEHEQRYFSMLMKVVGSHARVFPKVRLSDLVQPQGTDAEQRAHWMRVQRRCVDFLLCSPNNLTPVLAIDLDTRVKKRRREQTPGGDVLDNALKTANIPLLRIRASREYHAQEVQQQLRFALAVSEEPVREWFREEPSRDRTDTLQRLVENWLPPFSRLTAGLRGAVRRA